MEKILSPAAKLRMRARLMMAARSSMLRPRNRPQFPSRRRASSNAPLYVSAIPLLILQLQGSLSFRHFDAAYLPIRVMSQDRPEIGLTGLPRSPARGVDGGRGPGLPNAYDREG